MRAKLMTDKNCPAFIRKPEPKATPPPTYVKHYDYRVQRKDMNWHDAQKSCEEWGGNLVSIHT